MWHGPSDKFLSKDFFEDPIKSIFGKYIFITETFHEQFCFQETTQTVFV